MWAEIVRCLRLENRSLALPLSIPASRSCTDVFAHASPLQRKYSSLDMSWVQAVGPTVGVPAPCSVCFLTLTVEVRGTRRSPHGTFGGNQGWCGTGAPVVPDIPFVRLSQLPHTPEGQVYALYLYRNGLTTCFLKACREVGGLCPRQSYRS